MRASRSPLVKRSKIDKPRLVARLTSMPKVITIEQLARLCQREFTGVRKDMKDSETSLRAQMREGFEGVERKFDALAQVLEHMHRDIKDIRKSSVDVDDLLIRVQRIEKKIGIRK